MCIPFILRNFALFPIHHKLKIFQENIGNKASPGTYDTL